MNITLGVVGSYYKFCKVAEQVLFQRYGSYTVDAKATNIKYGPI